MEAFLAYCDSLIPLSPADRDLIQTCCSIRQYAAGENLLSTGEISKAFFFNLKGLVRLFYPKSGEEKTAWFYQEGDFMSAYESYVFQQAANLTMQALEPTEVVVISREAAFQLLEQDPKFDAIARKVMEMELIAQRKIISHLLTMTAEERYYQLIAAYPGLVQRVPQHFIAAFIGVKPESLSRIKKRHTVRREVSEAERPDRLS